MQSVSIVSLNCETGELHRYLRVAGNKPVETGRALLVNWNPNLDEPGLWAKVFEWLQAFREGYVPPEDPTPRPTSPLHTEKAA